MGSDQVRAVILIPFILAFLTFVMRFYFRESAASMRNPSFLFASGTVLAAIIYLTLRITEAFPPYGSIGFAVLGLALLTTGILRLFMI